MVRPVRLLAVLVLAAAAGCSLHLELPAELSNVCVADEDCDDLGFCETHTGMCVASTAEPLRVGLVVFSSGASEGVTFPALDVDGPLIHDLMLPSSILVAGKVRQAGTHERIPAQLRFMRDSAFPGGSAREVSTTTSSESQQLPSGIEVDYQARILRGEAYDIRVEPTGDAARAYPPLLLKNAQAPEEGDIWNLNLDFPERFATVHGSIVSIVGDEEVPEDGLQVRAVEPGTGRVLSSTAISGMTATLPLQEAEPGAFTIRLAPGTESFLLRISGGEARPLFPTIMVDPDLVYPGSIVVPRLEPVRYEALVEGTTPSGRIQLPDAVVTLRSHDVFGDVPEVTGTFRATATTDAQGRFAADVLPGTYDVIVTPAQADLAVVAQRVRIEGGNEVVRGQLFTVPQRARLSGSLEVWDGRPVVGATARASALRRPVTIDDVAGAFNRSTDAATDPNGLFTLRLDTGAYDVTIRPSSGSGFPWMVSPDWTFHDPDSEQHGAFVLPPPVPLRGLVHGLDGSPLSGAELKAYVLVDDAAGETRAIEAGRAVTGPEGTYELLLPPHL